jgi:hypothetical protein
MIVLCGLLLSIIPAFANIPGGGTTINGGILLVNNTNASGTGTVRVNSGGILGGTGIIPGGVTVNSSDGFAPGNANVYLLGTTNLAAPVTNWTRLLTNQFDGSGNFNFTSGLNTNSPQSFYLLELP